MATPPVTAERDAPIGDVDIHDGVLEPVQRASAAVRRRDGLHQAVFGRLHNRHDEFPCRRDSKLLDVPGHEARQAWGLLRPRVQC